jgi:hypothetical protein
MGMLRTASQYETHHAYAGIHQRSESEESGGWNWSALTILLFITELKC